MTPCIRCGSNDIIDIHAKCNDMCSMNRAGEPYDTNYVHSGIGIGGGDYVSFKYCGNCGQIVGKFPIPPFVEEDDEN